MNLLRSILVLLALPLLIISCKKEHSNEDGLPSGVIDESWEFKESGQLFSGPMDTAYLQTGSVKTLTLVGSKTGDGSGELFLQIVDANIVKGTYTNPTVFFQYSENGSVVFQSSPVQSTGFSLTIDKIDSSSVTGTFSGTVQDAQGNAHTISEGKFSSKLSGTTQPPPIENGKLTIWAKEICQDGGAIDIKVGGQTGQITDAITVEPACDAAGAASFTLPIGDYTVQAVCGTDTLLYDITIDGSCNLLEVDFQNPPVLDDYLPLAMGSAWDYADLADASSTHRIAPAQEDDVQDGRSYTRFESTNGDKFYYRKDQHTYYEYMTLDFQGAVDGPPSIEIEILHDDYDAGQSWETPGEDIIYSGIPVKVKLVSTIPRRDYTDTFNGIDYPNCIEVNTEILFSSDGGLNYQSSGSSYSTVFSKGIGIVYYYDLNRNTEWGLTNYTLAP